VFTVCGRSTSGRQRTGCVQTCCTSVGVMSTLMRMNDLNFLDAAKPRQCCTQRCPQRTPAVANCRLAPAVHRESAAEVDKLNSYTARQRTNAHSTDVRLRFASATASHPGTGARPRRTLEIPRYARANRATKVTVIMIYLLRALNCKQWKQRSAPADVRRVAAASSLVVPSLRPVQ
jgi:hypothetical protein